MKRNVSTKHVGRRIKYDVHSFIADIYIAPLLVGLLRSAPNPARTINVVLSCWENTLGSDRRANGRPFHTKGPTTRRPGSAWWKCEKMGHEGGPAQSSEGDGGCWGRT